MSTESDDDAGGPDAPAPEVRAQLGRRLRNVGWVLIGWGGVGAANGFVFGSLHVLGFYALVILMGCQAVWSGAFVRSAAGAGRGALEAVGAGYVRQSWLVVSFLALQIVTAVYLMWAAQ